MKTVYCRNFDTSNLNDFDSRQNQIDWNDQVVKYCIRCHNEDQLFQLLSGTYAFDYDGIEDLNSNNSYRVYNPQLYWLDTRINLITQHNIMLHSKLVSITFNNNQQLATNFWQFEEYEKYISQLKQFIKSNDYNACFPLIINLKKPKYVCELQSLQVSSKMLIDHKIEFEPAMTRSGDSSQHDKGLKISYFEDDQALQGSIVIKINGITNNASTMSFDDLMESIKTQLSNSKQNGGNECLTLLYQIPIKYINQGGTSKSMKWAMGDMSIL